MVGGKSARSSFPRFDSLWQGQAILITPDSSPILASIDLEPNEVHVTCEI